MSREEKPYTLLYIHAHARRSLPDWHPHSKDVFGKLLQPSKEKRRCRITGGCPYDALGSSCVCFRQKSLIVSFFFAKNRKILKS